MAIWEIRPDVNNFRSLGLVNSPLDWKLITYGFNGMSLKSNWNPIEVFVENLYEGLKYGDFISLAGLYALNMKAFQRLRKLLEDYGELLSLTSVSEAYPELHIYNVT